MIKASSRLQDLRRRLYVKAKAESTWRELETEPRTGLNGHAGGNPGYSQASVLTGHRASSRPCRDMPLTIWTCTETSVHKCALRPPP